MSRGIQLILSQLEELAEFQPANDERGIAFLDGCDIAGLDIGEILEQLAFLRNWAGMVQILSLAEPRPSTKRLDNPIFRQRLNDLEHELSRRRWQRQHD